MEGGKKIVEARGIANNQSIGANEKRLRKKARKSLPWEQRKGGKELLGN